MAIPSSLDTLAMLTYDKHWQVSDTFSPNGQNEPLIAKRKIVNVMRDRVQGDHLEELTKVFQFARETINFNQPLGSEKTKQALENIRTRYVGMQRKIEGQSCLKQLMLWFLMHFAKYDLHGAYQRLAESLLGHLNEQRKGELLDERQSENLDIGKYFARLMSNLIDSITQNARVDYSFNPVRAITLWNQREHLEKINDLMLLAEELVNPLLDAENFDPRASRLELIPELYHAARWCFIKSENDPSNYFQISYHPENQEFLLSACTYDKEFFRPGTYQYKWREIYNNYCKNVENTLIKTDVGFYYYHNVLKSILVPDISNLPPNLPKYTKNYFV